MALALITMSLISGYNPYSYAPVMGYGSDATINVVSQAVFQEKAWVADKDQYQRLSDNAIIEIANGDTDIESTFTSGEVLATNKSFDELTGKNTYTYILKAVAAAPDTVLYRKDKHRGVDKQTNLTVKDSPTPYTACLVTIAGPASTGGGGDN